MPTSFSFSNDNIHNYFAGDDSYIPVGEFLHVHNHPLTPDNFVAQIESEINLTAEYMQARNMSGKPVERLTIMTAKLGRLLPINDRTSAAKALEVLRDIYRLCLQITGKPALRKR